MNINEVKIGDRVTVINFDEFPESVNEIGTVKEIDIEDNCLTIDFDNPVGAWGDKDLNIERDHGLYVSSENIELAEPRIPDTKLYFAKTKPNAIIPTKRKEDAGRDIYTCETETIVIEPCSTRAIETGIAIGCSPKYFPKFFDKGGMGSLGIIVGAGVGDSGFRDGYFIPLINTNKDKYVVITNQDKSEIEEANCFDLVNKMFLKLNKADINEEIVLREDCIIKFLDKAITQFVMIEVPEFDEEEITWEELQAFSSERGMGKLGSSNK
jgi:dUTP pyrophosphatase